MAIPLLKTKLYIPPLHPKRVARPHLIERLSEGTRLGHKLTLISAPAGFGKTTLISEWIHQADIPAAWLSLDDGDNDPMRFWSYVIAALQNVHPGIGKAVQAARPQPPPAASAPWSIAERTETLVSSLINEIAAAGSTRLILVLDDLHAVTAPEVHEATAFLLDHLPPQMHLVLSTRHDPLWPLGRMRARREMTELGAQDLRFTLDEAAAFLDNVMGLALSAQSIAVLDARTEGWIAGLQMAALSMQGRRHTAAFIKTFSGSHRFVLDYLVEEVLGEQPSQIQEFLLKTSILDSLTASLCDAVMEADDDRSIYAQWDGQAMLTHLEQANLFLVPLDDERRWDRYHRLFAELLRDRLRQTQPEQLSALSRRASEWCEQNGLVAKPVNYALEAGDVERVVYLVAAHALTMIYHGELMSMARSLATLSGEAAHTRAWLRVAYAWTMAYAGQLEPVEPALQEAQEALIRVRNPEAQRITGHIAAIRTYVADLQGELSRSVSFARQALENLPEGEFVVRGFTLSLLGTALRDSGDLEQAARVSTEALAVSRAAGDVRVVVTALCELAALQLWQGHYRKAMGTCRQAPAFADKFAARRGQPLPVTALIYARIGIVLQEWNDLAKALHYAREAVRLCEEWGQAGISILAYSRLASVLGSSGDLAGALDALQKAKQVAADVSPWYGALIGGWEIDSPCYIRRPRGNDGMWSELYSHTDHSSGTHLNPYAQSAQPRPGGSNERLLELL